MKFRALIHLKDDTEHPGPDRFDFTTACQDLLNLGLLYNPEKVQFYQVEPLEEPQ